MLKLSFIGIYSIQFVTIERYPRYILNEDGKQQKQLVELQTII